MSDDERGQRSEHRQQLEAARKRTHDQHEALRRRKTVRRRKRSQRRTFDGKRRR